MQHFVGGHMHFPEYFCWTRYGTESGEGIEAIIQRKEEERQSNGGIFLWGVGNALAPSMRALIHQEISPEVVFSPIRSAARAVDKNPDQLVAWTRGLTLDAQSYSLPRYSLVTSSASFNKRKKKHYALVCSLEKPLRINHESTTRLHVSQMVNMLTGNQIGHSQVTAVVRRINNNTSINNDVSLYPVSIVARLVYPYFVELTDFVIIPELMACKLMEGHIGRTSVLEFVNNSYKRQNHMTTFEIRLPLR